jgi:hypothetical protein
MRIDPAVVAVQGTAVAHEEGTEAPRPTPSEPKPASEEMREAFT